MDDYEMYRNFTLQLSLAEKLGCITFKGLLNENKDIQGLKNKVIEDKLYNLANIDDILKTLDKRGIGFICSWEKDYSENLKNITDPPIVLYYIGNKELLKNKNSFSIVGSRRVTSYGIRHTRNIVKGFKDLGFNIVSGMAFGIDSVAHNSALDNNIPTIAVLASSADDPTPLTNIGVYNRILDNGGLILSESLPGTQIQAGYFPRRNRIIAGLSKGTLVVEAGEESGALITAHLAQSYDKDVFAIPGNIDSIHSKGSNSLIKNSRAKLVQNINDILEDLEIGYKNLEKRDISNLSTTEVLIYKYLESEPRFIEELLDFLKFDFSVIISSCSIMEMNGLISKNERGQYLIN